MLYCHLQTHRDSGYQYSRQFTGYSGTILCPKLNSAKAQGSSFSSVPGLRGSSPEMTPRCHKVGEMSVPSFHGPLQIQGPNGLHSLNIQKVKG